MFLLLLFLVCQSVQSNKVFVSTSGEASCQDIYPCASFADVIEHHNNFFNSNTNLTLLRGTHLLQHNGPVEIMDVYNLTLWGERAMEEGFHWTVKQSSVVIKCVNHTGGFVFLNSSVSIVGITFTGCGTALKENYFDKYIHLYDNGSYTTSYNLTVYNQVGATLFFIDSLKINFEQLSIQNCSGSCFFLLNSRRITMNNVFMAHNSPDEFRSLDCCNANVKENPACIGTNALFIYLDSERFSDSDTRRKYDLQITNSYFSFGAGSGVTGTTLAGVTIFSLTVANLNAKIDSVLFFDNAGGNFGLLSSYSRFTMTNVTSYGANKYLLDICQSLKTDLSFKLSITNELVRPPRVDASGESFVRSIVTISNSQFEENLAVYSAGINIDTKFVRDLLNTTISTIRFTLENSIIQKNKASQASCVGSGGLVDFPARLEANFTNVLIMDNELLENGTSLYVGIPPSCVVLINNWLVTFDNVTIKNHPFIGTYAVSTTTIFYRESTIQNNTSNGRGGGIALGPSCKLILGEDSTVSFINNRAQRGAGIYVFESQFLPLFRQLCVFQVKGTNASSNSMMYFSGNNASVTGNIIYGGNLETCLLFYRRRVIPIKKHLSRLFTESRNDLNHYQFSSDAEKLCFCEKSVPCCNTTDMLLIDPVFPGQTTNVSVATVGQLSGFTTGNITVNTSNYSRSYSINEASCYNVLLPIKSKSNVVSFTIRLNSSPNPEKNVFLSVHVPVKPCPPGFTFNNDSLVCQCDSVIEKNADGSNVTCDIISNTISHNPEIWVGFDNITNSTIIGKDCPFDYCIHDRVTFNIFDEAKQCAFHRSGVLCGGCADGYSLSLGTNECGECSNDNFLSLLLVFGVAGILLVVFIIVLNLTVSVGTINGIIFYANVVQMNQNDFFPKGPIIILSQFISLVNLDFGIKTCFYKEMTPYAKVWLQYIFPVYIWVIVLIIIGVSHYSSRLSKLVGSNAVPVLATLMLLSYTKLVRTLIKGIHFSKLYSENENEDYRPVWTVDGEMKYADGKHIPLLIVCLFVILVILLPFTFFVTFVPLFQHKISSYCPNLWLRFLKPISDAYSGPFTDSNRYLAGAELVARLLIAILFAFLEGADRLYVIFSVVTLLVSLLTVSGKTYRYKVVCFLEVWSYVNLLVMVVCALWNRAQIGSMISISLMCATFILVVVAHAVWRVKKAAFKFSSFSFPELSYHRDDMSLTESTMLEKGRSLKTYREPLLEFVHATIDRRRK